MKVLKNVAAQSLVLGSVLLASCGGGGGGGGTSSSSSSSTYGAYQSAYVSADSFVNALNNVDGVIDSSEVILYSDETYRSAVPGQEDFFVIWDAKWEEYKAVSLDYVRSIVYYDYYANTSALASEFRDIEDFDILAGESNGDYFGDDYEVVDYDDFTDSFWGRNSGYEYEDEQQTNDVNVIMANKEQLAFYGKAAKVSFAYNVDMKTSLSLVTLGAKLEKMLKRSNANELTQEDKEVVLKDMEKLTGVTFGEMMEAATDSSKKAEVLNKIADEIGTTAGNIEERLLPEVFGVQI